MDSSNLSLQNRVDQPVSRKHILALKLRGDNHSLECLSTSAYTTTEVSTSAFIHPRYKSVPSRQNLPDKSSISTC